MQNQKIIQQGAEAIIYKEDNKITKDRVVKRYRLPELDNRIRILRTRQEYKLLKKASKIINTPNPEDSKSKNETSIKMPYIKGKKLSDYLNKISEKESKEICRQIGESIAKLHDANIIHGDLTTSNIILDKEKRVWFIDFGLGFNSGRIEDKAVDLHLIKQALEAKHFSNWQEHWKNIESGYKPSINYHKTIEQLKKVESRGRYKDKY